MSKKKQYLRATKDDNVEFELNQTRADGSAVVRMKIWRYEKGHRVLKAVSTLDLDYYDMRRLLVDLRAKYIEDQKQHKQSIESRIAMMQGQMQ